MKTTIDLPPELVRAMKLRAIRENRKLKDVVAELLKRGLLAPAKAAKPELAKPRITVQANGLPLIRCGADAPARRMSVSELLALEQSTLYQEDLQRLGLAL